MRGSKSERRDSAREGVIMCGIVTNGKDIVGSSGDVIS